MPSFDVVSELKAHEVANAVDQAGLRHHGEHESEPQQQREQNAPPRVAVGLEARSWRLQNGAWRWEFRFKPRSGRCHEIFFSSASSFFKCLRVSSMNRGVGPASSYTGSPCSSEEMTFLPGT